MNSCLKLFKVERISFAAFLRTSIFPAHIIIWWKFFLYRAKCGAYEDLSLSFPNLGFFNGRPFNKKRINNYENQLSFSAVPQLVAVGPSPGAAGVFLS